MIMEHLKDACAECSLCHDFMPEQKYPRSLTFPSLDAAFNASILVIDYATNLEERLDGREKMESILGTRAFLYTTTVRCSFDSLPVEDFLVASSRCSVWTRLLVDSQRLIISCEGGLKQLKITQEVDNFTAFRVSRLGLIFKIPPVKYIDIVSPHSGFRRVLREAGL